MNKSTVITTAYDRKLTVKDYVHNFNLHVKDTDGTYAKPGEVYASLDPKEAAELAAALLGGNATVVTDLPKVEKSGGYLYAGNYSRSARSGAKEVLENAKALLAIHAFLVEQEKAEAEAKAAEEAKAKEAARSKRRDELATELVGTDCTYFSRIPTLREAIDRIIDLEEAAKV